MSRIGKREIAVPEGVDVNLGEGAVTVTGPKGSLSRRLRPEVSVAIEDGVVRVSPCSDSKFARALWGTTSSHIQNMVRGVSSGFTRELLVEGIGYRAAVEGDALVLTVGFSHPVRIPIPEGVSVSVEKNAITVSGRDKERVGQFAADVRATKKPEPYKGKGIRYAGEVVLRKQGKRAAT